MKRTNLQFEKASHRSVQEIKENCEKLRKFNDVEYEVRSNGNHIWVEVDTRRKHFWSPMLRLQVATNDGLTKVKGVFGENPLLWVTYLSVKLATIGIFLLSGIVAWYKYQLGYNYNLQLFVMFGMVSVWFGMFLLSESYKRKGKGQIEELSLFVDAVVA